MKDDTNKAEVISAAKTAKSNYSFRSSDGIGDTFWAMFSNPETLKTFSMSRSKLSYLMANGLGPVFKNNSFMMLGAPKLHSAYSMPRQPRVR